MAFEFEKEIKDRKLVFGEKNSLKQAKKGSIEAIYISSDCRNAEKIKNEAKGAEVRQITYTSAQMQEMCKKPFPVSVVSVIAEEGRKQKKKEDEDAEEEKTKQKRRKKKEDREE